MMEDTSSAWASLEDELNSAATEPSGPFVLSARHMAEPVRCFDCGRILAATSAVFADPEEEVVLCWGCVTPTATTATVWPGERAEGGISSQLGNLTSVGIRSVGVRMGRLPLQVVVTANTVWVVAFRRGDVRVDVRRYGPTLSRRPRLFANGRPISQLVRDLASAAERVRVLASRFEAHRSLDVAVEVRPALVLVGADFGWWRTPMILDGVWVGSKPNMFDTFQAETVGLLPVPALADLLADRLA